MERTRFIEHRGRRILVFDYSRLHDPAETVREIERSKEVVRAQPPGSLLVLTNVREARYNTAVIQALKDLATHNAPYVKASAVVGMSGLHRIVYQTITMLTRRSIQTFDTEAEGLDWLASQG